MSRTKEPPVGKSEVPKYKSPNARIIRSLRKGYDNLREKVIEKSKTIRGLQGKMRDTQESREHWKTLVSEAQAQIEKLQRENEKLKEDSKKKLQ
jgi:FtsZ-binding cell division protein ZapB